MRRFVLMLMLGITVIAVKAIAAQASPLQKPAFDVAAIKLSPNQNLGGTGLLYPLPDGRFTANAVTLRVLIFNAYGLNGYYKLIGGPEWMNTVRWTIEAKALGKPTPQQVSLMTKSLLEDRFKLKVHWETRELPVYDLVAATSGIKLPSPRDSNCIAPNTAPLTLSERLILRCGDTSVSGGPKMMRIDGGKVSMATLIRDLENILDRPVVDKTGFTGTFDVNLLFAREGQPESSTESGLPTISTAIQEQLGLKLESTKGPVEVLVIDHAEKPSEN